MKQLLFFSILVITALPLWSQDTEEPQEEEGHPQFGSVDQVDNRIKLDRELAPFMEMQFLSPYFEFKDKVKEKTGLTFAVDYNSVYMSSTSDLGEGNGGSGVFRFYGSWDVLGKESGNTGSFVYKVEHRHAYTDVPPASLGFDMGYAGLVSLTFSDQQWRATNFYWRQRFAEGRIAVVAGFMDITDFFDVYALASPWMHFSNYTFSTGAASAALPNDGYLGIAAGGWINDNLYAIAGFGDINSDPTDIFNGFNTFFDESEYFKHVEIGFTTSKEYIFLDNVHASFWQRDASSITGDPSGWGFIVSGTTYVNKLYLPFLRYGYSQDGGSILSHSVSGGIGYQPLQGSHLLGIGINWGQVNETTFGPGLEDQWTFELFYRLHLTKLITFTPDIQFLVNPALNPENSSIFLFGIRGRIAL